MTGCHAPDDDDDVVTNLPFAATDHLAVAVRYPMSHHSVATSSAHLLQDFRQLTALSLTTECQGHFQRVIS